MQQARVNVPVSPRSFERMTISFKKPSGEFKPKDALDFSIRAHLAKKSHRARVGLTQIRPVPSNHIDGDTPKGRHKMSQAAQKEPVMSKPNIVFSHNVPPAPL
jgi:hypothetical protein